MRNSFYEVERRKNENGVMRVNRKYVNELELDYMRKTQIENKIQATSKGNYA